jgi:HEAT repeat protein
VAWFFRKRRAPELAVLEQEILESTEDFSKGLKKKLNLLDFDCSWQLTKKLLPQVEKIKARSLVRLLFADKTSELAKQLENREKINHVIACLEYLPSRETVEVLGSLLAHRDETIQLFAAGALKNHTPRLVVPYLIEKLLNCEVPPARAGEVLLAMGHLAQDALLEVYEQAKPQVQAQILELLTLSHNPKCQSFLRPALQSEDPFVKKAALQAVSTLAIGDLWSEVAVCLDDSAWQIRVKALEVLTKLRAAEALETVRPLLEDEDPWVRKTAATFLEVLALE